MHEAVLLNRPPPIDPEALDQIAGMVYRHTGIRLGPRKGYLVEVRLLSLYRELGCRCWSDLPHHLVAKPASLEQLVQSVVTGETSFFRDQLPFQALDELIVPELTEGRVAPAPFRVWCAGCSTGQEAYSIAMALWDRVERGALNLEIWATDICRASLARAEEGVYLPTELRRGLNSARRDRFFRELPAGSAEVRDELRRRIRFQYLNLINDGPVAGRFHAVFCRNVAIYFDRDGKERMYGKARRALLPGGYMILGASETLFPGASAFETVYFRRSLLFRRRDGDSR